MRIGSFWGLPAPMIVIALQQGPETVEMFRRLNTIATRQILDDVRKEFSVLAGIKQYTSIRFKLDEEQCISARYPEAIWDHGSIQIPGVSLDVVHDDLRNELIYHLAQAIVTSEARGHCIKLPSGDDVVRQLKSCVDDLLASSTFRLGECRSVVTRACRKLRVPESKKLSQDLMRALHGVYVLPTTLSVNGEIITVSDNARKVFQFYLNGLDIIEYFLDLTNSKLEDEERVFDTAFLDLLKRKPTSLLYIVQNKFDFLKDKQTSTSVYAVRDDVAKNVNKFRTSFDKFVVEEGTVEEAKEPLDPNHLAYLQHLGFTGTEFSAKSAKIVYSIHQRVDLLTVDGLNRLFGLDCTESEWWQLSQELCRLGICGINTKSKQLFEQSVQNICLMEDNKIVKSKEYVEDVNAAISDIQSLLDTILPIGAPL